jgi:hypothetical protein
MVPDAQPRSYYGMPIIKEPTWTWEIPWYLFVGGMAGASAPLALGASLRGNRPLARSASAVALGGAAVSPLLLVSDLGRPERFLNMLRVFKPTSPMNMGSWILSSFGPAAVLGAARELTGLLPGAGRAGQWAGAVLGPALATYTGVLLADTAVPVWHDARRELPFVFAGSAIASAGAACAVLTPPRSAGPARRMAAAGLALEVAASELMERRLGDPVGEPYQKGTAARLGRLGRALGLAGAGVLAGPGRRDRVVALGGAALVLAGSAALRWSVFKAGFQSARDPRYTVEPQRERLAQATRSAPV